MESTDSDADYLLNFFNIPKSNSKLSPIPASPSPSAQSENSVECNQNTNDTVVSTDDDSQQELTNLTWLTQLKNLATWPDSVSPMLDENFDDINKSKVTTTTTNLKKDTAADRFSKFIEQIIKCRTDYDTSAELFQSNSEVKPIFNYAQIIAMAMYENGRMTLQQICSWIEKKFAYFRARKNWNNSIRHNLSLNCCFRKIDRSKYEKGKGGYWELGIDETKYERKRVRNRKPRLIQTKDNEINNDVSTEKKLKITQNTIDRLENDNEIQEFFTQQDLREFNLEENLDVTAVINQTFNNIEEHHQQQQQQRNFEQCNSFNIEHDLIKNGNECDLSTTTTIETTTNTITKVHSNSLNGNDGLNSQNDDIEGKTKRYCVSSTLEMLDEDFPNGALVDPTTMDIQGDEIYLANEVPQPSENVIISILNNYPCNGPNVIVEPLPYAMPSDDNSYKPLFDGIDEELQFLRNCDIDSLYDLATNEF